MEKRFYYSPEMKLHKLRGGVVMQAATNEVPLDPKPDEDAGAKGFGSFTFEDED